MAALWRVRDRATFAALRREGRRRRAPAVTVTSMPAASGRPAVAFAIGRSVGTAVARNRLRRRLKAILVDLDLAPGTYLVSAGPAASGLSPAELRAQLASVVA